MLRELLYSDLDVDTQNSFKYIDSFSEKDWALNRFFEGDILIFKSHNGLYAYQDLFFTSEQAFNSNHPHIILKEFHDSYVDIDNLLRAKSCLLEE